MKPNFSYTLQEVEDEVGHIFGLGWFAQCQPQAEDTRDGVKLTIQVPSRAAAWGASLLAIVLSSTRAAAAAAAH